LATVIISFNGHRSAVTILTFDEAGVRLASGSKDTDIVAWDLIAETGLFRLRGHTNQITGLRFLQPQSSLQPQSERENDTAINHGDLPIDANTYLLSCGKDALLKLWDLETQHCIETHVTQNNGECWALSVSPSIDGCITAGNEGELKFWAINTQLLKESSSTTKGTQQYLKERGVVARDNKDRTLDVKFHPKLGFIAAHGSERSVEIFRIRSENEVRKSLARKRKRRREKNAKNADSTVNGMDNAADDFEEDIAEVQISEFIVPFVNVRTTGKLRSMDWSGYRNSKSLQVLVATSNNQLELYNIELGLREKHQGSASTTDYNRALAVDIPGHRTDVRSLSLSSDDRMLASASNGSLKVWNIRTQSCLRSLECGYALCSAFLPGDKIVAIGNRNGELELFDISSSTRIETVKAHDGPIWTLHVHPEGRAIVTGSADKTAKFWNFEVLEEEVPGSRRKTSRFTVTHARTLKVADDILCIRFSPNSKLLAVATLDNTVKIFFVDSLKMFLNLYGHKLPVLSMDISYDSKLIVTCSADKNVRLWGLDFGDCHKAFFAHQDSIMQVGFVPHNQDGNGHHFFSASKDRLIKYWDGDKFEQIQKLAGHHGEIWAMVISRMGEFLVTASHDKSVRIWKQTDEQIFLEEEREKELEELYESTLVANLGGEDAEQKAEVAAAGKQTVETLMAGEKIAEALDVGIEDLTLMKDWRAQKVEQPTLAPPQRNIIFMAYGNISAEHHVLSVIEKIKAAALQDALLVLTFDKLKDLLAFVEIWADRQWNIPLVCRVLFFLLKTHHRQLIASKTMRLMLNDIRGKLRSALQSQKSEMGFNVAALRVLGSQVQEKASKHYVDENLWNDREGAENTKKRTFISVA
jgi:U3 small nucleolar RNA-associated protein 12